jgi:arylsulfatase A-like enzyme
VLVAKALDFIDQSAGQPFLLYFSPYSPHGPACPAPRHLTLFQNVSPWRPPNYDEAGDDSDKPAWVQNACPMGTNKKNNIDALRVYQLGAIQSIDEGVGAIMQKLRDVGQDANTLVLFVGQRVLVGLHCHRPKQCPYECIRTPLVVRYPARAVRARRIALRAEYRLRPHVHRAGGHGPDRTAGRPEPGPGARRHGEPLAHGHPLRALGQR